MISERQPPTPYWQIPGARPGTDPRHRWYHAGRWAAERERLGVSGPPPIPWREASGMTDIVRSVSRKLGVGASVALIHFQEHWSEIVGPDLARRCHPVAMEDGSLVLEVAGSVWLFTLRRTANTALLAKVRSTAYGDEVRSIVLRAGRWNGPAVPAAGPQDGESESPRVRESESPRVRESEGPRVGRQAAGRAMRCLFAALCLGLFSDVAMAAQPAKPASTKPASAKSSAPTFSNAYASPRSKTRAKRRRTQFIILHTTEGGRLGALEKLRANGECHYVVDKKGVIYRIVDRRRVAFHCGRSMWNGQTDLDSVSIGIEIVGEHNHDLTTAQYASLKYLLSDLKRIYGVPDDRVLTHSMVAYGTPNRWQKKSHRGRKRCGMLLADPGRRLKMGLRSKPSFDPDLRAKRLVDADPELTRILYGSGSPRVRESESPRVRKSESPKSGSPKSESPKSESPKVRESESPGSREAANVIGPKRSAWDIARDRYNSPTTLYRFPNGTEKKGSEIRDWKAMPTGTLVVLPEDDDDNAAESAGIVGRDAATVRDLAGDEALLPTTFYIEPGARTYLRGSLMTQAQVDALPGGTRVLVRYAVGGPISARRPVFSICDVRWNRPETYYLTPKGEIIPGNAINERSIPSGAWVFYQE